MRRLFRIAKAIFRAAASENKKNFLAQKYNVPDFDIDWWSNLDPTPNGKYVEWIVRRVSEGNIRLPEDNLRVEEAIHDFIALTQKKNIREQYQVNPDIHKYTLHDLEDLGDRLHGREGQRPDSLTEVPPGAKKVYDDGEYAFVKVTDPDVACSLAAGTKWCTSDREVAQQYLENGPLHVIYKGGQKIGQTDGMDVMDLRDREIDLTGNVDLFKALIEADLATNEIWDRFQFSFDDPADWVRAVESSGLLEYFMQKPIAAVRYAEARAFIPGYEGEKRRLKEAEPMIMKDPWAAGSYAQSILRQRWPDAEPYIAQHPQAKAAYEQVFGSIDPLFTR